MIFYTYILQSQKSGRLYIGHTDNLSRRLAEQKNGKNKSTKNKGPWIVLHYIKHDSRAKAYAMEAMLKKWKNKHRIITWIEKRKLAQG